MSFRLFIYYCALCGGWAAFIGFLLGSPASAGQGSILKAGTQGLLLGLFVALGLSLVDALWNLSIRQFGQVVMRVGVATLIGALGGMIGGMIGQALYAPFSTPGEFTLIGSIFLVFGWTLTGLLIGTSVGLFEWIHSLVQNRDQSGTQKKLLKALIGGTLGGIMGGVSFLVFTSFWTGVFSGKPEEYLWSPRATGFVALGMCIGLLIGLAQVILREAWIRVESGFKPGREKLLSKERTTIGRAEACDIGLFGDNTVEKLHASIILAGNRYFVEDAGTSGGTYLNEKRINGRTPIRNGDMIRVGRNVLCFREKQKRT